MLIKRGKYDFLIGASWHMSQDKTDLKELMAANAGKSRVMLMANEAAWVGFDPDGKNPAIAAALAFAAVFPDLLVVEHMPDDRFWLCAIHQGMPAPGRDQVVDAAEVRGILLDWISYFPTAAIYGDVEGALGSADAAWQRVLEAIKSKEITSQQLRNFRVKRVLTKLDYIKIFSAIGVLLGLGLGSWYMTSATNEAETAAQRAAREEQEAKEREIARRVEAHKAQLVAMRAEVDQMKGKDTLTSWLNFFVRQPYQIKGYAPTILMCSVPSPVAVVPSAVPGQAAPGMTGAVLDTVGGAPAASLAATTNCEVEWQASGNVGLLAGDRFALDETVAKDGATLPQSKQVIPQVGAPEDNLRKVRHVVADIPLQGVAYAPPATERSIERVRAALIDAVRIGSGATIDPVVSITVPMVVPGVPDAQLPNVTVAHRGEFNLIVNGSRAIFDMKYVNRKLTQRAAEMGVYLRWTSLKVHSSLKSDSITAKAEYFVLEAP